MTLNKETQAHLGQEKQPGLSMPSQQQRNVEDLLCPTESRAIKAEGKIKHISSG